MKTYITQDGERFEVRTARELLRQLRARAFVRGRNQAEWMKQSKRRVYQATHCRLDLSSESAFVAGLVRAGLIEEKGK